MTRFLAAVSAGYGATAVAGALLGCPGVLVACYGAAACLTLAGATVLGLRR